MSLQEQDENLKNKILEMVKKEFSKRGLGDQGADKGDKVPPNFRDLRGYTPEDDESNASDKAKKNDNDIFVSGTAEDRQEYIRQKLIHNPYIKSEFLQLQNSENMRYFINFNTSPYPNYKLKYYNYFTTNLMKDFHVQWYLKYNKKTFRAPQLHNYVRYEPYVHDEELENRDQRLKNSKNSYSGLYQAWDNLGERQIQQSKQYTGKYASQHDYQYFKIMQQQEIKQSNDP